MTELELKAKLYQKLLKVKEQVTYLKKDTKGFNFEYASPELVLGTLNPLLNEVGLFLKTEVLSETHERVFSKYKTQDIYVNGQKTQREIEVFETLFHLNLKFTWVDTETGFEDSALFTASGINNDEQGQGSAQTYGERYFLLKTFNIATGKDDPDALGAKRLGGTTPTASDKAPQATKATQATTTPKKTETKPVAVKTQPKKAEPTKLIDGNGELAPNASFDDSKPAVGKTSSLSERQQKAIKFFSQYNEPDVIKFLIKEKKMMFASIKDFVEKTPIEEALAIASEWKELQDKK